MLPPTEIQPSGSEQAGEIALETPFVPAGEGTVVGGDTLQLQSLELSVPGDGGVTGLTFVARSADGSAWFRDGMSPPLACY